MTDVFGLWLESLDIEKVKLESFHSSVHRAMVREHEARKRAVKQIEESLQSTRRKRSKESKYVFTDRQIEIAVKALSGAAEN